MDNTQELPFIDNSFDTIVLRRGLCVCHNNKSCAGFCPTSSEAKHFFDDVVRVLDKSNPKSIAILHGQYKTDGSVFKYWLETFLELEFKYSVEVKFIMINSKGKQFLI